MPDPRNQAAFDKLGHMAMQALSDPQAADTIAQDAKATSPAKAIVNAVGAVIKPMTQAAAAAGVELPPDVVSEAQDTIAKVIATMMVQSGMAEDAEALASEVAQLMSEEPGEAAEGEDPAYEQQEEANPAMEQGEPDEEQRQGALVNPRVMR